MKHLNEWLESGEFLALMHEFRKTIPGSHSSAQAFEAVKEGVRNAIGLRTFVITSVEYNNSGEAIQYTLKTVRKNEVMITLSARALGKTLLDPGTRVVMEIQRADT